MPPSCSPSGAQVICDVLALEEAGHVSPGILQDVLAYIPQEDQFAPLLAYDQCYNMREGQTQGQRQRQRKRTRQRQRQRQRQSIEHTVGHYMINM